jgi:hypothetical protein
MEKFEGGAEKEFYVKPAILATYSEQELEQSIKPHGPIDSYTGECEPGCGCGCGCPD